MDSHIKIQRLNVADHHAEISMNEDGFAFIQNFNETFLNGNALPKIHDYENRVCHPKTKLESGDIIMIDSRQFRFEYPEVLLRTPKKKPIESRNSQIVNSPLKVNSPIKVSSPKINSPTTSSTINSPASHSPLVNKFKEALSTSCHTASPLRSSALRQAPINQEENTSETNEEVVEATSENTEALNETTQVEGATIENNLTDPVGLETSSMEQSLIENEEAEIEPKDSVLNEVGLDESELNETGSNEFELDQAQFNQENLDSTESLSDGKLVDESESMEQVSESKVENEITSTIEAKLTSELESTIESIAESMEHTDSTSNTIAATPLSKRRRLSRAIPMTDPSKLLQTKNHILDKGSLETPTLNRRLPPMTKRTEVNEAEKVELDDVDVKENVTDDLLDSVYEGDSRECFETTLVQVDHEVSMLVPNEDIVEELEEPIEELEGIVEESEGIVEEPLEDIVESEAEECVADPFVEKVLDLIEEPIVESNVDESIIEQVVEQAIEEHMDANSIVDEPTEFIKPIESTESTEPTEFIEPIESTEPTEPTEPTESIEPIESVATPVRRASKRNIDAAKSTPVKNTPIKNTPVKNTPIKAVKNTENTPIGNTPIRNTPVKDISSTPIRNTPLGNTPVKNTTVSPARDTPVSGRRQSTRLSMNITAMSTPVKNTKIISTPMKSTPVKSTLAKNTPISSTPIKNTPVKSPLKSTPRSTPTSGLDVPMTEPTRTRRATVAAVESYLATPIRKRQKIEQKESKGSKVEIVDEQIEQVIEQVGEQKVEQVGEQKVEQVGEQTIEPTADGNVRSTRSRRTKANQENKAQESKAQESNTNITDSDNLTEPDHKAEATRVTRRTAKVTVEDRTAQVEGPMRTTRAKQAEKTKEKSQIKDIEETNTEKQVVGRPKRTKAQSKEGENTNIKKSGDNPKSVSSSVKKATKPAAAKPPSVRTSSRRK